MVGDETLLLTLRTGILEINNKRIVRNIYVYVSHYFIYYIYNIFIYNIYIYNIFIYYIYIYNIFIYYIYI